MFVVPLSVAISFWQEVRCNAAGAYQADAILDIYYVRRKSMSGEVEEVEVNRENLVPGDIVSIKPGSVVPADCIVLESSNLSVNLSRYGYPYQF